MYKGYDVFRAQSPNSKADLIAYARDDEGRPLKVEVKTGWRNPYTGLLTHPKPTYAYDVLAIVLPDEIIYRPDMPDLVNVDPPLDQHEWETTQGIETREGRIVGSSEVSDLIIAE